MKYEIQATPRRRIQIRTRGRRITLEHQKILLLDPAAAEDLEAALTRAVEATEDLPGGRGDYTPPVTVSRAPGPKVRIQAPDTRYTLSPEEADTFQASINELLETISRDHHPARRFSSR